MGRGEEPYRTSATGPATYRIPRVDVQASLTWQSNPGPEIAANYVASNAVIAAGPQPLARNLSGGANVAENLIEPGTVYGPRRNNFDLRLSRIQRCGSRRLTLSVDGYNPTNADTVLAYNKSFVPAGSWLVPTRIEVTPKFRSTRSTTTRRPGPRRWCRETAGSFPRSSGCST